MASGLPGNLVEAKRAGIMPAKVISEAFSIMQIYKKGISQCFKNILNSQQLTSGYERSPEY
jgi:hypothetical protein